jgi:hypothetical protein
MKTTALTESQSLFLVGLCTRPTTVGKQVCDADVPALVAGGFCELKNGRVILTPAGTAHVDALLKAEDEALANDPEHQEYLRDQEDAACEYNDERRGWGMH